MESAAAIGAPVLLDGDRPGDHGVDAEPQGLSPNARLAWRVVQVVVWLVGVSMVLALLFVPVIGLHAFWNVLIPVAPALLAIAPGLWRNICPMASTALTPRHLGMSQGRRLDYYTQSQLLAVGLVLLAVLVPLRHVAFDLSGPATAIALLALAAVAVVMGFLFDWKSGWCSGLCPVHPVERLYGTRPALTPPNAHCGSCVQCASPCPDSTPAMAPLSGTRELRAWTTMLFVGGFAGYIWGWFQVQDYALSEGMAHLGEAYAWPFAAGAVTFVAYMALRRVMPAAQHAWLARCFAGAAIALYYWYRLPMLFGYGPHPGDGMLVDLTATLPASFPLVARIATTVFFLWWLVLRRAPARAWAARPAFADAV